MTAGDTYTQVVTPKGRACASFDGVDDKIVIPSLTFNNYGTSISVWLKTNTLTANDHPIFGLSSNNTNNFLLLGNTGRVLYEAGINNDNASFTDLNLVDDKWHNLVITSAAGTNGVTLYVDGRAINPTDNDVTNTTFVIDQIGRGGVGATQATFEGDLSDLRIFNTVLTATEALKLANGENVTRELIHRWKLETDAVDSVGGYDGTVTGAVFEVQEDKVRAALYELRAICGAGGSYSVTSIDKGSKVLIRAVSA